MSEDTADLTITLKAGTAFSDPWVVVRGNNPDDVLMKLNALDDVIAATVDTANKLKAANAVAPIVQGGSVAQATVQETPQASNGWGSSPAASQQTHQAPPQNNGVRHHPEGKLCPSCMAGVIFKEITSKGSGKTFQLWTCPNQRSKGDGHYSEFAN